MIDYIDFVCKNNNHKLLFGDYACYDEYIQENMYKFNAIYNKFILYWNKDMLKYGKTLQECFDDKYLKLGAHKKTIVHIKFSETSFERYLNNDVYESGIFDINKILSNDIELIQNIKIIECDKCHIAKLIKLPLNLTKLDCSNNSIANLDGLPHTLKILNCSKNKIKEVSNLPHNLEVLICSENTNINLDYLPESLIWLDCSACKICNLENH